MDVATKILPVLYIMFFQIGVHCAHSYWIRYDILKYYFSRSTIKKKKRSVSFWRRFFLTYCWNLHCPDTKYIRLVVCSHIFSYILFLITSFAVLIGDVHDNVYVMFLYITVYHYQLTIVIVIWGLVELVSRIKHKDDIKLCSVIGYILCIILLAYFIWK